MKCPKCKKDMKQSNYSNTMGGCFIACFNVKCNFYGIQRHTNNDIFEESK